MAKLTKFKAQQVEFGTHYKIEETNRGDTKIKSITPAFGNVREPGTPETEEIYNGLQLGNVHTLQANKTTNLNIDYYVCNLDGLTEFGVNNDLKLRINVDTKNTNATTKLRLNNIDYTLLKEYNGTLKQIEAEDFKTNKTYELVFNGTQFIVINIAEYGTTAGTALEGNRLAEILGIEFGGNIQDTGNKVKGKFYFDSVTKFYYECIENTNLTYNESSKFRAISNKPISDKVENLYNIETHIIFGHLTQAKVFKIGRLCILSMDSNDAWKGVTAGTVLFNLPEKFRPLHYTVAPLGQLGTTENAGVQLETDGRVIYRGHQSIKGALYFNVTYLTK
jgi:hypothetical protein|nr:MAG TPA: receptor binding protein [Caudoviricetes sp.]